MSPKTATWNKCMFFILMLLLSTGCYRHSSSDTESDSEKGTAPENSTDTDFGTETEADASDRDSDTGTDTEAFACPYSEIPDTFIVEAEEGLEPDVKAICESSTQPAIISSSAADVVLTSNPDKPNEVSGTVYLDSAIADKIDDGPIVTLTDAVFNWLLDADVSKPTLDGERYLFDILFPGEGYFLDFDGSATSADMDHIWFGMTLDLTVSCDGFGNSASMSAQVPVNFHYCRYADGYDWFASGAQCTVCIPGNPI